MKIPPLLLLTLALLLSACGSVTSAATATATAPSGTATPALPTPTNVPTGWQVFAGSYLTIAYPPGWIVEINVQSPIGRPPGTKSFSYEIRSLDRSHSFAITEEDHLDTATIQQNCAAPEWTSKTVAGLPMRFNVNNGGVVHIYEFLTDQGVAYQFIASIAPGDTTSLPMYESIMETFRPVYTTPACT